MRNKVFGMLRLAAVLMLALPAFMAQSAAAQGTCRTFPETGQTVCDKFLTYWDANGGLAQQGFPITAVMSEMSSTDGKIYTVQYFERSVFEQHPEFAGTENEVLLQLLGVYFWNQRYPSGAPNQTPNNEAGSRSFTETGKKLGGVFQKYWETHGGLRQQGFPISDEFIEVNELDGKPYKVQYMERAVFEYHPENLPPNDVLLSQLGTFAHRARHMTPPTPTTAPAQPTATPQPAQPTATPQPAQPTPTTAPVSGCAALPPANPNVFSIPASRCGRGGTIFGWSARGFNGGELVGVYITLPDGSVFGAPFQVDTDDNGEILGGVSFQTASNFPQGRWAITFEGVDSHVTQIEYFVITP